MWKPGNGVKLSRTNGRGLDLFPAPDQGSAAGGRDHTRTRRHRRSKIAFRRSAAVVATVRSSRCRNASTQEILVTLAERPHPFPSRTRKLSSPAPKILRGQPFGKIGRRRDFCVSRNSSRCGRGRRDRRSRVDAVGRTPWHSGVPESAAARRAILTCRTGRRHARAVPTTRRPGRRTDPAADGPRSAASHVRGRPGRTASPLPAASSGSARRPLLVAGGSSASADALACPFRRPTGPIEASPARDHRAAVDCRDPDREQRRCA